MELSPQITLHAAACALLYSAALQRPLRAQLLIDAYLLCFIDLAVTDWPIDAGDRVRVRFDGDEMYDGEVKLVGDTAGRELQVLFDDDELSWNARVDITDLLERAPETTGNDAHASTFTRNPP